MKGTVEIPVDLGRWEMFVRLEKNVAFVFFNPVWSKAAIAGDCCLSVFDGKVCVCVCPSMR